MSRNGLFRLLPILLLATLAAGTALAGSRNVVLIIGDGMDDQQITIARNYLKGAQGRLGMDALEVRSTAHVLTVADDEQGSVVYVADSANTATSIATGVVTSRGRIATSAGSDQDLQTIVELAEAAGMKTGIVSTASVTDATPASFVAHISMRFCEDPSAMEEVLLGGRFPLGDCKPDLKRNGGLGSISEQIANSPVDVVLGGGAVHFAPKGEGEDRSVLDAAVANGFQIATSPAELLQVPADGRLLGLFSESTMPVRLQGQNGRIAEKPKRSFLNYIHRYLGKITLPETMSCETNPASLGVPTLQQMTDVALARLSSDSESGFFLMIESASIDKQSHARSACGSIGELEQLEEALASVLAFAERKPDTLVLLTSDHGHAAQLVPSDSLFTKFGIPVRTPGRLVRLKTPEGAILAVNYATSNFIAEEHTGVNVPLFSNAVGRGRVPAMVTQPELFDIMVKYLELEP